jgi:hypothetical protein
MASADAADSVVAKRAQGIAMGALLLAGCVGPHCTCAGSIRRSGSSWAGLLSSRPVGHPWVEVSVTDDPHAEEAWLTEARVKVRALIGIPYGQQPEDIVFLSHEQCEAFRATHTTYTKPDEVCRLIHSRREPTKHTP